MSDQLIRAISKDGLVKAVAVSTRDLTEQARQIHKTLPVATAALGRTLAAASMMGNALKEDGASVTLQIKGGGPLGTILAVSDNQGNVRGTVDNPAVDLPLRPDGKLDVGAAVGRDGTLTGDNTDLAGLEFLLRQNGWVLTGQTVVILGSGGTGHTAKAAAEELGAAEIATVSRTGELNYENLAKRFGKRDFYLINTTPVGMAPQSGVSPLDLRQFPRCKGVADVIYNPLRTRLCQQAAELGIPACGGLLMLAAQAAAAEYAFGTAVPEETVLRVYRELLAERRNLVFIGMPGSGKTTIGRLAAQMLEREFIDCDEEYLLEYGITPEGELLAHGELYFREREEALLRKLSPKTGCVVAAGGGAILREENVEALRENGLLCWLRRPLELLPTEGRPLSTDLPGLYRQREPLYRAAADFSVENTGLPKAAAEAAARGLDLR